MPTTIGPITNVPMPGDPVDNDWAVDLTTFAVNNISIGAVAPTDPNAELWYDTADGGVSFPNMPRGLVAQAVVTASQGPINTATNLTGLTVTFTTDGTRRIKYSWKMRLTKDPTAGAVWVELMNVAAVIDSSFSNIAANNEIMMVGFVTEIPPAGTVTRHLRMSLNAGSVTMTATAANRSTLLAEDIGGI